MVETNADVGSGDRFEAERPRLLRLAGRMLGDDHEAHDVVQEAWLRLDREDTYIDNVPGWLTTVTSRLCLDRLRSRRRTTPSEQPRLDREPDIDATATPEQDALLADAVGVALQVVLDRLTPRERVAFVLHDSFGFEFDTIGEVLDTNAVSARKLASRARGKVAQPRSEGALADWQVVDAFLAAARGGDLARLLELLAPDAVIAGDESAVLLGTPAEVAGRDQVAKFFSGAAHTAFATYNGGRAGAAWFDRGRPRVVFDFMLADGRVRRIDFRAAPAALAGVRRRDGDLAR